MPRTPSEHSWALVADCLRCGRPLRLVRPRSGGGAFFACTNRANCGYTTSRDAAMEDLAFQYLEACDILIRLAALALPRLLRERRAEAAQRGEPVTQAERSTE